jgi:TIR domain
MSAQPKRVFISHIHEEARLGGVVKGLIEDTLGSQGVTAFLSSDMQDNPTGRKWVEVIAGELDQARVVVSLISPTSLGRPWVNIELGAGWIKGRHIIPLCHSGQRVGDLPRPFGDFNGVGLDQDDAAERLLGGVADAFGLSHPRRLDFARMLAELRTATGTRVAEGMPEPVIAGGPGLERDQITIFRVLADAQNNDRGHVDLREISEAAGIKMAMLKYHLNELGKRRFTQIDYYSEIPPDVQLLPAGAEWLVNSGHMPE